MKMDLAKGSEGDNVNIELTVSSLRPPALLCTQLVKLADVADVEVLTKIHKIINTLAVQYKGKLQ